MMTQAQQGSGAPAPGPRVAPPRALTRGPKHHFFGYYGISPWSASEKLYACLESDFHERMPEPGERATVGVVDLASGRFEPLATTAAWNLQQGAMLHWLPPGGPASPDSATTLVFNDLDADAGCFRPVVLDVAGGARRTVPAPVGIGAVSPDGRFALGLDYARLHHQRPVVGYAGANDRSEGVRCPDDDGVWRIDLLTGETTLLLSHAAALAGVPVGQSLADKRPVFFNHTLYNPAGTRLMVFLRYFDDHGRLDSAVFTVGADGRDLRCLVPWGNAPSHFDWRSADELLVTVSRPGGGRRYVLLRDRPGAEGGLAGARLLGGDVLIEEGHPSFSPDRRWLVFDGGHDAAGRLLRLYDDLTGTVTVLGHFYAAPQFEGDIRCDLHPRWNRSGTQVSVDSVHGGDRQVYVVDLGLDA